MLCTDIQVPAEEADKAFMRAWNFLVSHGMRYTASFREMARDGENELIRYRARELGRLLGERGRIREFDYRLCNKVLDHIEGKRKTYPRLFIAIGSMGQCHKKS